MDLPLALLHVLIFASVLTALFYCREKIYAWLVKHKKEIMVVGSAVAIMSTVPLLPLGDPVDDDVAYFYEHFVPPANSFGIGETTFKTVNWAYFKQLFLAHTAWRLEYKRYESSAWTNGNEYLTIERTWNESGYWKFNLILDAPVDVYSARFTFGIDLPCLQYVERNGYEVWVNYTANATETYSCMFNWSDMMNIPGVIFTHGKTDEMFWFRFRRDNIPAGHYEFDPTFGTSNTGVGAGARINGVIRLFYANVISGSGYATKITARLYSNLAGTWSVKCALYLGNTFVSSTEEKSLSLSAVAGWYTFNFSSPPYVINANKYSICIWGNEIGGGKIPYVVKNVIPSSGYRVLAYAAWPSPMSSVTNESTIGYAMYCTYDRVPTQSSPSPANASVGQSLAPRCAITVADIDADSMDVTFASNYSGDWVNYQTNVSVNNGTYRWDFTGASSGSTTYWWKVYADDGVINTTAVYHFTTELDSVTPDVPDSFTATTQNRTVIGLSWNKGTSASHTYIRYAEGGTPPADRDSGTFLYNDTGTSTSATGLDHNTQYSFSAWSFNDTYSTWNETASTDDDTTDANQAPTQTGESPGNSSTGEPLSLTWSITIADPEGDTFDWDIECSSGDTSSADGASNGSKELSLSGLDFNTEYTVWVNISDEYSATSNEWYVFTTKENTAPTLSNEYPTNGSIDISLTPTCNITINDTDADLMTLYWYENSTGSYVLRQTNGSSDWYDSSWTYRKKINVTGSSGAGTDYQVLLYIGETSGATGEDFDLGGKSSIFPSADDSGDLAFTDDDGITTIDFWVEDVTGTTPNRLAKVWVEVADDLNASQEIYCYYNNSGSTNIANGSNTFLFFDDFSQGLDKWTIDDENEDCIVIDDGVNNGAMRHNPDSSQTKNAYFDTRCYVTTLSITNFALHYKIDLVGAAHRKIHQFGWRTDGLTFDSGYAWRLQNSADDGGFFEFADGSWSSIGTAYGAVSDGTWYYVNVVADGSEMETFIDGSSVKTVSDGTTAEGALTSHVHGVSLDSSDYVLIDDVFVRKFITTEPAFNSVESEESNSGGLTNGTYRWDFTQASTDDTTYWWKVSVNDTYNNVSTIYHFTTESGAVPRINTNVFDHWFSCGNNSYHTNTQVFDHWFSCGNGSTRSNTMDFDYYFICGNESTRPPVEVFDYWFQCGNETTRPTTNVFDHWFLCGNASGRSNAMVFDYWFSCGNNSYHTNTQVFDHWFSCGNSSYHSTTNVFDYWFLCGNETTRPPVEVFDYWFQCGNETTRPNVNVFNYWFLCGNASSRSIVEIFDYWFSCGNSSGRSNTMILDHWFLCGNASGRTNTQVFDYWFSCGNETIRNNAMVFDFWFLCGNESIISLNSASPITTVTLSINGSNITKHTGDIWFSIQRNHTWGYLMNTSFWFNDTFLFTNASWGNGTIGFWLFDYLNESIMANISYTWVVNCSDHLLNYNNVSYSFKVRVVSGGGFTPIFINGGSPSSGSVGSMISYGSIFLVIGILIGMMIRKKKKDE